MPTLRPIVLSLFLAASVGLSACGDDSPADQGKVAPTDPVVQDVQEQAASYDAEVQAGQKEIEAIEAKVASGEITRRKGDAKVDKITEGLKEKTTDLTSAAESAAKTTGGDVTKLDLGGDASSTP